ncbi:hypothetical protein [Bermanella sp. R86510]|uniref:hypothetical protein n=1 Tax=unclassified Bermanella TaxID=2627862 RepID=UPI0037C5B16C
MAEKKSTDKKNERLINRDPRADDDENAEQEQVLPFYKQPSFLLVLKISVSLGVISSLLTGLFITNSRLSGVEEQITEYQTEISAFKTQQDTIKQNLETLTEDHEYLVSEVKSLDLTDAKGDLSQALSILNEQSEALDKQLAITRNGLLSLSRMIKGSRVWQEDYSNQYQRLFEENEKIKQSINDLRGVQEEKEQRSDPRYLEMEF